MHLARLRLRDFRNYARLDAAFVPGFHLLLGENAQGKTNILEAIYLLGTLRSFRGVGGAQMVRQGQKGYFVGASVLGQVEHEIKLYWSERERTLSLDGQPVRRLSDYLGSLRAVVICSDDVQLVKGPGSRRRRFLDLLLTQTEPGYIGLLQRYAQTVRARNALLKQARMDAAALESFDHALIDTGERVLRLRQELLPKFSPLAEAAYARIAQAREAIELRYQSTVRENFAVELAQSRGRERAFRATVVGPHRDDVALLLGDRSAAQYGSEGQKRSLAIALKLAQTEYITQATGVPPVLLIDDVMGELDAGRRSAFVPILQRIQYERSQVFMTATEMNWPEELGQHMVRWTVQRGELRPA